MAMIKQLAERITKEVHKVVVGGEETIDLLLTGLFAGGHVLLEDVPGVGKTVLAKSLAASMGCQFTRIQCTPDLLPTDVVGTTVFNQKTGEFYFREGPLFSQLVLADEINRAVPRTQSALLEAMAERQVTVDGTTHPLDTPFFVIATQNPVEAHGTFPLPEAQLDRFALKISLGYPSREQEREIVHRSRDQRLSETISPVAQPKEILAAQKEVHQITMTDEVEQYLLDIVQATRTHKEIRLGGSPRATILLGTCAQALAGLRGRDYVIPDDIKYLAPMVLAHRLVPHASLHRKQKSTLDLIEDILAQTSVPVEEDAIPMDDVQ